MSEPEIVSEFEKELEHLINKYGIENESNTPDFILARMIRETLSVFAGICGARDRWFGDCHYAPRNIEESAPKEKPMTPDETAAQHKMVEAFTKDVDEIMVQAIRFKPDKEKP